VFDSMSLTSPPGDGSHHTPASRDYAAFDNSVSFSSKLRPWFSSVR
jgi:hypothetical protein